MVFTRSITTLELSTSIGIDLGTSRSKVLVPKDTGLVLPLGMSPKRHGV
uniref:Uncharacterized protein n=1 Tax=Vitis vinifera TaxID=29760 RepID=F6HPW5_VITVI